MQQCKLAAEAAEAAEPKETVHNSVMVARQRVA